MKYILLLGLLASCGPKKQYKYGDILKISSKCSGIYHSYDNWDDKLRMRYVVCDIGTEHYSCTNFASIDNGHYSALSPSEEAIYANKSKNACNF